MWSPISKDEFLKNQSKEQLIIFLKNREYVENRLRNRLFLLTGCSDFGNCGGMNGSCVECSYDREKLFESCHKFKDWFHEFIEKEMEKR